MSTIQQCQERTGEDFSNQEEQASVPIPCDQEPEGKRGGLPVERSEDLSIAELVDQGHPVVEPLPSRPESRDGVDGTNVPDETPDVNPTCETQRTCEEGTESGATGIRLDSDLHIASETIPDIPAGWLYMVLEEFYS